jgi:hypothetical protein
MDDPDLSASIAIIEMDCSSAHIRDVNIATERRCDAVS